MSKKHIKAKQEHYIKEAATASAAAVHDGDVGDGNDMMMIDTDGGRDDGRSTREGDGAMTLPLQQGIGQQGIGGPNGNAAPATTSNNTGLFTACFGQPQQQRDLSPSTSTSILSVPTQGRGSSPDPGCMACLTDNNGNSSGGGGGFGNTNFGPTAPFAGATTSTANAAQNPLQSLIGLILQNNINNNVAAPAPPTPTPLNNPLQNLIAALLQNSISINNNNVPVAASPPPAVAAAAAGIQPITATDPDTVGTEPMDGIAQQLNQLSLQERDKIDRDIYGSRNGGVGAAAPASAVFTSPFSTSADATKLNDNVQQRSNGNVHRKEDEKDEEDPNILSQKLDTMEQQILQVYFNETLNQTLPASNGGNGNGGPSALSICMQTNPTFVQDKQFCLAFLRAEDYDPSKATTRLIEFLEMKRTYWGEALLTKKHINISDMNQDDIACLNSGFVQHIPTYHYDSFGRPIIAAFPALETNDYNADSFVRALYYIFMSVAFPLADSPTSNSDGDDDAARHTNQRKGVVIVTFAGWAPYGKSSPFSSPLFRDPELLQKRAELQNVLPIKINASHGCTPDAFTGKIVSTLIRPFISLSCSFRVRIHYGPHLQIQYELLKYGIPPTVCQVDHRTGQWTSKNQKDWVKKLQAIEVQLQHPSTATNEQPRLWSSALSTTTNGGGVGGGFIGTAVHPQQGLPQNTNHLNALTSFSLNPSNGSSIGFGATSSSPHAIFNPAADASPTTVPPVTKKAPNSKATAKGATGGHKKNSMNHRRGPVQIIHEPTSNDCLLGRGKSIDQHDCNIRFRKVLQDHPLLYEYSKSKKDCKRKVTEQMLKVLRDEYNIERFLVECHLDRDASSITSSTTTGADGWIVANDDDVIEKIARTFRRTLKVQKAKQQQ